MVVIEVDLVVQVDSPVQVDLDYCAGSLHAALPIAVAVLAPAARVVQPGSAAAVVEVAAVALSCEQAAVLVDCQKMPDSVPSFAESVQGSYPFVELVAQLALVFDGS